MPEPINKPISDSIAPQEILVIAEQREGRLNRASLETLAAAQAIGQQAGWPVHILLAGHNILPLVQELASYRSAKVYSLDAPSLEHYTAEGYVSALKAFLAERPFKLVLLPHTYQVRDFAPSLALALDTTLVSDCVGYKFEESRLLFVRQMFQGKFLADVAFVGPAPWLATIQAGSFRAEHAEAAPAGAVAPIETLQAVEPDSHRVIPAAIVREAQQSTDLSQAEVIVSVGRGIKEQKNIALAEELARLLGGEVAASRPICDNGWIPFERQIGSSGQTVAPKLYMALGISGAIQHLVGMKGSRSVIAINHDAEAPIFEIADYGVVGDLFEIVPALNQELKKTRGPA